MNNEMQTKVVNADSSQRASFLDSYRGLACLLVCFCHSDVNLSLFRLTFWGFTGVHLFFIISGYLIFQPFLKSLLADKPLPSLARFYQNRFVRIVPPYLAAIAFYLGMRLVTHTKIPTPENIFAHIFLIFNYFSVKYFYSINPVLWTLAIEAQFYLILPLAVFAVRRVCKPFLSLPLSPAVLLLILFFIVGIASRGLEFAASVHPHGAATSAPNFRSIFSFLDMFGIGMVIAYLEKSGAAQRLQRIPPLVPLLAGICLLISANLWCSLLLPGEWMNSNNLLYTLCFSPLICIGFGLFLITNILYKQTQKNIFNTFPLVWIGLISYSVYLYHTGVQFVVFGHLHLNRHISNWTLLTLVNALIALPVVLLVSGAMYFLIEKPSLDWLKRRKRIQQSETAASPAKELMVAGKINRKNSQW